MAVFAAHNLGTFSQIKNGNSAKCKLCSTILKATGGSTKGLHEHMKRIHSVNTMKRKCADDPQPSTSTSTGVIGPMKKFLLHSIDENSLLATLSRLTACDGLSFRVIVTSKDLRRGLVAMGFSQVPTSVDSIKQQVMKYGKKVHSFVTATLDRKKTEGQRFSLTLDEWTSTRNRHYMNMSMHVTESTGALVC